MAALTGAMCAIAVVIYASHVPRDPVSLITPPAASGHPAAGRPATPVTPQALSEPEVDLSVVVWPRGPGRERRAWTLACPPMTTACRAAIRRSRILAEEGHGSCPTTRARTPEAMVTGYVDGRYVTAWIDQRDGCGLRRWRALAGLLRRPEAPLRDASTPARTSPATR